MKRKKLLGTKMEQINVLVSTYNGEKYIEEQLKSIDCQTYSNVHVYVRDDGSTDHTVELVNRYIRENELSDKYTVATGENIGFSKSFHLLMQMADSGEYWAFCDQDDVWYPNKLSNAVKWMQTQKNDIPLLYQSKIAIGNSDLSEIVPYKYENYNYNFQKAFTSNIFFGFAMVINRELYDRLIRADFDQIKYHDWFAAIIVSAFGKYVFSEEIEAVHRQHENNASPLYFFKKIPDGIRLLRGDNFYTRNAREFDRLFLSEMDEGQKEICTLFINEKYSLKTAVKKTFYPKRWNMSLSVEFILRALMLIGKI